MKKAQFFLRFSFLTKKQQHEFGRYLIALHPKKQTAIAIYQFYEQQPTNAPTLTLPRPALAALIFPTEKAKQTKLDNGLSDLNIVIEEYLNWITAVKGVRNEQQGLALVKAYTKNGDEKGLDRVVGKLEKDLANTEYKTLEHYKVHSELMDLKVAVPFASYRKNILKNYQESARLRSQLATRSALTYMVEYEINHVGNKFEFELPMRKALNSHLQSETIRLDNYLKVQLKLWKLYDSKQYEKFSEFRDDILSLIPDEYINEKVEFIKMLKNFVTKNRSELNSVKANQAFFELNTIHMELMLSNKQVISPTLFFNFVLSSKGVARVEDCLNLYKNLLPIGIRDAYYYLGMNELALHYHEESIYVKELLNCKFKISLHEVVRRRNLIMWAILEGRDFDEILKCIYNLKKYLFRNKLNLVRITT